MIATLHILRWLIIARINTDNTPACKGISTGTLIRKPLLHAPRTKRWHKSGKWKATSAKSPAPPDRSESSQLLRQMMIRFTEETAWRKAAAKSILPALNRYDNAIKSTIGLRLQKRLTTEQAKGIAACQSVHRDISLNF